MVTVVLLPGLDGSATLFEPFVAALGQQHEVRAISYPSTVPLGYAELEGLVRSSLPKAGPFVVLGESFSGPVAVGLAAEPPPGLLGIVLCCSFARNPRPFLSLLGWVIALVPVKLAPVSLLAVALLGRHSNPYWRSALAEALSPVSAVALRARLRAVLEVNALSRLAKSKVPVLYLRATEDRVVPVSASKSVAQALPSVTIIPIPGPHFLLQVSPEPAAVAVHDFIRTLSPAL
jgi:pimeloyl-ACP methyl ester carboxylesterase